MFSGIAFRKVQIDGYYLSEYDSRASTSLRTNGKVQVKTGPLIGDGDAFNTTFVHD